MRMDIIDTAVSALGGVVVGSVGSLIKLYTRMSIQEKVHEEFVKRVEEKFDAIKEIGDAINKNIDTKFESQGKRLDRIERSMNGHLQME